MNYQRRPDRWLPGWYTLPVTGVHYTTARRGESSWPEAADWLRSELHRLGQQWAPTKVHTVHVASGGEIHDLSFANCWDFIEWACVNRQHRGVWGRDEARCYYIITADDSGGGLDRAQLPVDLTPPLSTSGAFAAATR